MEGIERKADGRRIFSVEFKRQVLGQVVSGEKTLAELSRELEIQPAVLRNWMRLVERGGTTAVAAGEDAVPDSRARSSSSRSRISSAGWASRVGWPAGYSDRLYQTDSRL